MWGIQGIITTNGKSEKVWKYSLRYKSWYTANNIYYRCPNHLNSVRRELGLKAGSPTLRLRRTEPIVWHCSPT